MQIDDADKGVRIMKDKRFMDDYDQFDKITVYAMMILFLTLFILAIYFNVTKDSVPPESFIEAPMVPFG